MANGADKAYEYEVALSFAGEDRPFVERVAESLKQSNIEVYYDRFYEVHFWGEDLVEKFDEIYGSTAKYVVMFISKHYANKMWTNFERRTVLSRMVREERAYLLPARFDDTKLKGIRDSIAYFDIRHLTPEDFAAKIIQKITGAHPSNPPHDNPTAETTVIHSSDVPIVLYSVNTWLSYQVSQNYYADEHFVWCSPNFSMRSLAPDYQTLNYSPSTHPLEIYRSLNESVQRRDRHSVKIEESKSGILKRAHQKHASGGIDEQQLKEIAAIVRRADVKDFRPLLYVIPYSTVAGLLKPVPIHLRASPLSIEYVIEALPRQHFDIIEP